jgi:ABC-type nitrate/sulfonate/bicarbonate transport system substrate-binding protein
MKLTRIGEIRRAGRQAKLYNRNLLEAFEKGAQWADANPENKWRDVTTQPKANVEVLADVIDFNANNNIFHEHRIAYLSPLDGKWYTPKGEPVRVAYWQPLPELPEPPENE